MGKNIFCIFLLVLFCANCFISRGICQEKIEITSVECSYLSKVKVNSPVQNSFEQDLKVQPTISGFRFNYPIVVEKDKTYLIHGFSFQHLLLDYENWDIFQEPDCVDEFYALGYELTLSYKFSEVWTMNTFLHPGIASDVKGASLGDMHISGGVLFDYRTSGPASYGLGLAYAGNFGDPLFVPLIRFAWDDEKKLRLNLILPAQAELWYKYTENLELGLRARLIGNQYKINKPGARSNKFNYLVACLGPSFKYHFTDNLSLGLDAGMTLFHRLQLYDRDTKVRSLDLKNGWFSTLGVYFNI